MWHEWGGNDAGYDDESGTDDVQRLGESCYRCGVTVEYPLDRPDRDWCIAIGDIRSIIPNCEPLTAPLPGSPIPGNTHDWYVLETQPWDDNSQGPVPVLNKPYQDWLRTPCDVIECHWCNARIDKDTNTNQGQYLICSGRETQ